MAVTRQLKPARPTAATRPAREPPRHRHAIPGAVLATQRAVGNWATITALEAWRGELAAPGESGHQRATCGEPGHPPQGTPGLPGQAGSPLSRADQEFFEVAFGQDLSAVRIHTGSRAAASAARADAHAYTIGQDIVFAAGRYAPATSVGRLLLAHELSHVIQQRRGLVLPGHSTGARAEAEADRASRGAVAGQPVAVTEPTATGMARQPAGAVENLQDEELEAKTEELRAWLLDPAHQADPQFEERKAYLAKLERVVAVRNPQYAARAVRQQVEAGAARALGAVGSALPGLPHPEIIPFLVELAAGMDERVQQLPAERAGKLYTRYRDMSLADQLRFAWGYVKGIGIGVWKEIEGIADLVTLPFKLIDWLAGKAAGLVSNWGSLSGRATAVVDRVRATGRKAVEEVGKALRNPAEAWRQLDRLFEEMIKSGLQKANLWGRQAVDQVLEFLEQGPGEVGKGVGVVVGRILFNVLLAAVTDAIGNLVKEGASVAGKLASVVAEGVGGAISAVRRFLPKVLSAIKWLGEEILKFLRETLQLLGDALKGLLELFEQMVPKVAEATGPGGARMAVRVEEEAGAGSRALMSSVEGKVPRGPTTTTVDELYGRSASRFPEFVNQYVADLRARFPKLAEANLRPVPRDLSQPGLYEEGMLTGSRAQLEADFAERKSGMIQFDDINEEGKIIDSKVRESGRQYGPREPASDVPAEPDVYEQMTGGRPSPSRPWEGALSEKDEIQLAEQIRFAREHGLTGVEWRTTSARYAALVRRVIRERGWDGFVEILDVTAR